ncbi:MAG: hypothetical protein AAGC74_11955 [Verrucomicrobiota bacterium]
MMERFLLMVLGAFWVVSCEKPEVVQVEDGLPPLVFAPVVGEEWEFEVTVSLDPEAEISKDLVVSGPEGPRTTYKKLRRYVGRKEPEKGKGFYHCFEVYKEGELAEYEFMELNRLGIHARGWQQAGQSLILMNSPAMVVPSLEDAGAVWSLSLPNPNNPSGPPMMFREFRYFGIEPVEVGKEFLQGRRVQVQGQTGPLSLQRDYWFVDNLGYVKERKAYYLPSKRVALMEEKLVAHRKPVVATN